MNNMTVDQKIEVLNNRMLKLFMNPCYAAQRNHIRKIESQLRYFEKFVKVGEDK